MTFLSTYAIMGRWACVEALCFHNPCSIDKQTFRGRRTSGADTHSTIHPSVPDRGNPPTIGIPASAERLPMSIDSFAPASTTTIADLEIGDVAYTVGTAIWQCTIPEVIEDPEDNGYRVDTTFTYVNSPYSIFKVRVERAPDGFIVIAHDSATDDMFVGQRGAVATDYQVVSFRTYEGPALRLQHLRRGLPDDVQPLVSALPRFRGEE